MPKPRIYVETTIPSAYHTDRTDPDSLKRRAATRTWWDAAVHSSELVTSDVVLQELENGRPEQARLRLILASGLHLIQSGTAELTAALTYVGTSSCREIRLPMPCIWPSPHTIDAMFL